MNPPDTSRAWPIDISPISDHANFMAQLLKELAANKRLISDDQPALDRETESRRWSEHLLTWAHFEELAAGTIRGLVAEIERLRSCRKPT